MMNVFVPMPYPASSSTAAVAVVDVRVDHSVGEHEYVGQFERQADKGTGRRGGGGSCRSAYGIPVHAPELTWYPWCAWTALCIITAGTPTRRRMRRRCGTEYFLYFHAI
eukprot:GHVU01172597.1.p1 GENE.GHVU01172597.1~~GHVU01172597.1.p1  ORF type:complete len:109 (+),score=4.02 GHVU01172597.1:680-1006(+)